MEIQFDDPGYGFDGDTVCIGAEDVPFYIDGMVPGACYYEWVLENGISRKKITELGTTFDFPIEETYTIEVIAHNYCYQSEPATRDIVAADLPPFEMRDTICEGDPYTWIGPYGNEIIPRPDINTNTGGDFVYRGDTENSLNCPQSGTLRLHIRDENDEYPTRLDSIICIDQLPITIRNTVFTGNVQDVIVGEPIASNGCDSFFSVNLTVLGGNFFIRPACDELGNVIFRFEEVGGPQLSWYEQFALYDDTTNDYSLESEFIAVEKDSVLSNSLPMTLSQKEIEDLAENGALNVQLRLIIKYDGEVICNSISPPVEFSLDDNFPRIDQFLGDTTYCPGQELELYADVHHPASPAPFGEFPDSIGLYNWYPPDGFTTDSPSVVLHDTLYMQAPSSPTENTVCLKVTTERCLFTDSVCRELMIDEPIQPILEPDNETCDTFWTFAPDTVEEGVWSILRSPGTNNSATFSDTTDPNATVTISERGVYTFLWREGAQSCAKYDSVTIDFLESTIIPQVSDTCYDLEFVAEVILTNGRGGYTIHPSSTITGMITDSTFVSDSITIDQGPGGNFGDVLYLVVEDSLGCISDPIPIRLVCNCETKIGDMSPQEIELCEGETAVSNYLGGHTNDGTDTIMYILHAGPLSELEGIVDSSLNGSFMYPADIVLGQTYYISAVIGNAIGAYVDLDDPCLQVAQGQAVTWYEIPVTFAGEPDTTCGFDYNLQGISSVGQFNWNVLAGPGMLTFSDPSDPNANISVNIPGTYQLRAIEDNKGCADSSVVSIHFLGEIEYQLFYECDSAATSYVATVILSGGGNEYTLVEGTGTLIEDTLKTNPIPKGESRQLIIDSDFGCGPDTIEVESDCECLTQIGVFNSDTTLITCEENCINVTSLYDPGGESLDGNDIGVYILHQGDDTIVVDPIQQDQDGQFCYTDFQSELDLGDTVYVSYAIGNNVGNDRVDLNDPCLKVTVGAQVVFKAAPMANAGMNEDFCGLEASLSALPTSGTGQWRYIDGPSANVNITTISDPSAQLEVDMSGSYLLEWNVSEFGCVDRDTVRISFLDAPQVENVVINCDSTGSTYTVSFDIFGGQSSTYSVSGVAGSLVGSNFTSQPIPSDSAYRFVVSDGNNCDSVVLMDTHNCSCITSVGTLSGSELLLCEDEVVSGLSYDNTGEMRDANDEIVYALVDEDGNVIATSPTPDFAFDDGILDLNTTYYVRVYLGSVIAGQFQFDETCTDYDGMIPVTWYAYPNASAVALNDSITCSSTSVAIDGSLSSGQNLIYAWTTTNGSIQNGGDQAIVTVTAAGMYTLTVTDSVSGCSNDTSIQVFQSDDIPLSMIQTPDTLNCTIDQIELDGGASSRGSEFEYEWSISNGNIVSTNDAEITAIVDEAGNYTLTVTNTTNSCEAEFNVTVIEDRMPPLAMAEVNGKIRCNSPEVMINGEGSSFGQLIEYQWTTQNGDILSDPTALNINVSSSGTYQLLVLNTRNGCKDSVSVVVEQDANDLHNLQVALTDPSCFDENNGSIQVDVEGGVEPITFSLDNGEENESGVFTALTAGIYNIVVEDANGCRISDTVRLNNPPELKVMLTDGIEVQEGDSTIIEASISGGLQYDTIIWKTMSVPFDCLNPECTIIRIAPPSDMVVNVLIQAGIACSDRDSTYIIVKEVTEEQSVYIPNAFSPNGDGVNDYFLPETGQNVNRITLMQIFDRWGNLVFESRNFRTGIFTEGWDGKYKGKDLNSGVFTYVVDVLYLNGDQETITGTVTLIK